MRALLGLLVLLASCGGGDRVAEAERLIELLHLQPGATVAEIGAGSGEMAVVFARALGPTGRFYATELEAAKRADIAAAAAAAGLSNVSVLEANLASSNLPAACCDVVYMRRVYHHFIDAAAINQTIFQALKPDGKLAVIDFEVRRLLPKPEGVDASRPGHGIPELLLIQELGNAGFLIEERIDDWPGEGYCVIAAKPPAGA